MSGIPLNRLYSLSSRLNSFVFFLSSEEKQCSIFSSHIFSAFTLCKSTNIYFSLLSVPHHIILVFIHQSVDQVRVSWMLSERKRNGIVLAAVVSFWFVCLIVSELITCGNKGCQVTAELLKTVLKCCVQNMSFFMGFSRMAVLWSYRDKFTSGRLSNRHVRMRGASLAPHMSSLKLPLCKVRYNAKLQIRCV